MINGLNIFNASTNSSGIVYDSVEFGNYVCIVGQFTSVDSFATNGIALVNKNTGELDKTSELAVALSSFFPGGVYPGRVIYDTSDGHPFLAFITFAYVSSNSNRCSVFFTDTLQGYDFLTSPPVAFSSPPTPEMNRGFFHDMKVCDSQRAMVVTGNFYLGGTNGCVAVSLDDLYDNFGISNACVYAAVGSATAYATSLNFPAFAIENGSSKLFLFNGKTLKVDIYTISSSDLTFVTTVQPQLSGAPVVFGPFLSNAMSRGLMCVDGGKLFVPLNSGGCSVAQMDTTSLVWQSNYIHVIRNQAFGGVYLYGMNAINNRLYIWGSFTNAWFPKPSVITAQSYLFNKRQGLAVFNISSSTPSLTGEDLALSSGVPFLSYIPPVQFIPFEQSGYISNTLVSDKAYLFTYMPRFAHGSATISGTKVGTDFYQALYKNGVLTNSSVILADVNGFDAQNSYSNLIF